MYIKMIEGDIPFCELSVGTVFIYDIVPYIKIEEVCEQHSLKEGGVVIVEHNALNLNSYEVEGVPHHTLVTKKDSALIIGKGKGEV